MSREQHTTSPDSVLDFIKTNPQALLQEMEEQLPEMLNLVNQWHEERPTLNINYAGDRDFDIVENDFYKRQRLYLSQAADEANEFYSTSQSFQHISDVAEELNDVLFFLLGRHENNEYLITNLRDEFAELGYPESLQDLAKLKKTSAEQLILSMVSSLNNKAEPEYKFAQADRYLVIIYTLAFAYAHLKKVDLSYAFERTKLKNDMNYPEFLFNELTPFLIETDARSFLRIIRNTEGEKSLGRQVNDLTRNNFWFMGGHHDVEEIRRWVLRKLDRLILENRLGNPDLRNEAWRLREVGKWDTEDWPTFVTQRSPYYQLQDYPGTNESVDPTKPSQIKMEI